MTLESSSAARFRLGLLGEEAVDSPRKTRDSARQEIATGMTLSDRMQRAMRPLRRHLGAVRAVLFVADTGQRTLRVEAVYRASPKDFRARYASGVAGRVAEAGHPIVVPSVRREPMALDELANPASWPQEEELSLVSVPVALDGRGLGALSVYFTGPRTDGFAASLGALGDLASEMAQGLTERSSEAPSMVASEAPGRAVFEYANMIGASALMRQVYEEIGQVAQTTATALILGESGTGKELVAQAIHANSERASQPFIKINAASFPEALFESEIFGHERGAFTGAFGRKEGRLDRAQGGTLFLDEVAELPLSTQVKLLRVLQFREYERLGGHETLKADVRLIAATNKNMTAAVAGGTFREDLYYRLNVFTITLPSLRERPEDIRGLAEYFLDKSARQHRRGVRQIATSALDLLCGHTWPGNVRELENAIERAVIVCGGFVLEDRHLPATVRAAQRNPMPPKPSLAEAVAGLERRMIEDALSGSEGNLARAARALGTTERILRYKGEKYGFLPQRSHALATRARAPRSRRSE